MIRARVYGRLSRQHRLDRGGIRREDSATFETPHSVGFTSHMAQTTSTRRRRSWPAALIVLLIVLGGLWAGAWYYGSGVLERTIDGWKAREARAGRVYTRATQTIGGFPV